MRKKYIDGSKDYYVTEDGYVIGTKGKKLAICLNNGYPVVVICYKDGSKKSTATHTLVAKAFLEPPTEEQIKIANEKYKGVITVNHIDGNKTNNHYTNLEWATYQEQITHAHRTGLNSPRPGEESNFCTISESTAHEICKMLSYGSRNIDIVKTLGVSRSIVDQIRSGLNWKHVSCKYEFPKISRRRSISDATAEWVCQCLEKGWKPKEIMEQTTSKSLTKSIIKTIKRRNAYHHITCKYKF